MMIKKARENMHLNTFSGGGNLRHRTCGAICASFAELWRHWVMLHFGNGTGRLQSWGRRRCSRCVTKGAAPATS